MLLASVIERSQMLLCLYEDTIDSFSYSGNVIGTDCIPYSLSSDFLTESCDFQC